jgi:hypothetical protein
MYICFTHINIRLYAYLNVIKFVTNYTCKDCVKQCLLYTAHHNMHHIYQTKEPEVVERFPCRISATVVEVAKGQGF